MQFLKFFLLSSLLLNLAFAQEAAFDGTTPLTPEEEAQSEDYIHQGVADRQYYENCTAENRKIIKTTFESLFFFSGFVCILNVLFFNLQFNIFTIITAIGVFYFSMLTYRLFVNFVLGRYRAFGGNILRCMIVGDNSHGLDLYNEILKHPQLGYRVKGIFGFKKKFSKRPPPGIIVQVVEQKLFQNTIETFGTAVPAQIKSFNIEKYEILEPIKFNTKVKTGDVIAKLKNRNLTTPFDGIIGKRDFSNDIDVSKSSIILNLEDTSVLFVDVDIPETFAPYVKKGQNVNIKFSGNALKKYSGTVESTASRIDTNKRSLPVRIKLNNPNNELLSGSLLEISINYNERNSLSILDTSLIMEGDNVYVYKVDNENTVKKVAVEIGLRKKGIVEIKSGLENGDTVVAEGLKKTRPNGKIKPIKYGTKQKASSWKKKGKPAKTETKKNKFISNLQ